MKNRGEGRQCIKLVLVSLDLRYLWGIQMELSRSLFKRENWVGDIDLRVIKEYNWSSPEKVFVESKEGFGLSSKEHQHLHMRNPYKRLRRRGQRGGGDDQGGACPENQRRRPCPKLLEAPVRCRRSRACWC